MCDGDENAWLSLDAVAAQVVEKVAAPAEGGGTTGAGALATRDSRAQHHDAGRKGVVIWIDFSVRGSEEAGDTPPPHHFRDFIGTAQAARGSVTACTLAKRPARTRR